MAERLNIPFGELLKLNNSNLLDMSGLSVAGSEYGGAQGDMN
jgi:hypothetical protein